MNPYRLGKMLEIRVAEVADKGDGGLPLCEAPDELEHGHPQKASQKASHLSRPTPYCVPVRVCLSVRLSVSLSVLREWGGSLSE